jgi:hypothetical protein
MLGEKVDSSATLTRKTPSPLVIFAVLTAVLGAGIGAGIGIGYGIWHEDGSDQTRIQDVQGSENGMPSPPAPPPPRRPVSSYLPDREKTSENTGCPPGQHSNTVVTIMMTSNNVTVTPLNSTELKGVNGTFGEITFPRTSMPELLPYVTNEPNDGRLYRDVLNTTEFLDDWASLATQLAERDVFFQPAGAAKKQCRTKDGSLDPNNLMGADTITQNQSPNAMIRFESDPFHAFVVDVFDVRATEDGQGYTLTFRQAPPDAALNPEREGQCHKELSLTDPHYHHTSACVETKAEWNITELSGQPAVVFVNTGTWCVSSCTGCWGCCAQGGNHATCCPDNQYETLSKQECTCTDGTDVWGCCLSKNDCPSPPS